MIAVKMMLVVLFVFLFSLLLERLLKFYGPQSPIMLAITSFAILSVALYIILSHAYSSQDRNWAYVSVGIVLGLWLKNSRQQPTTLNSVKPPHYQVVLLSLTGRGQFVRFATAIPRKREERDRRGSLS